MVVRGWLPVSSVAANAAPVSTPEAITQPLCGVLRGGEEVRGASGALGVSTRPSLSFVASSVRRMRASQVSSVMQWSSPRSSDGLPYPLELSFDAAAVGRHAQLAAPVAEFFELVGA
jgi:hypothetical protein